MSRKKRPDPTANRKKNADDSKPKKANQKPRKEHTPETQSEWWYYKFADGEPNGPVRFPNLAKKISADIDKALVANEIEKGKPGEWLRPDQVETLVTLAKGNSNESNEHHISTAINHHGCVVAWLLFSLVANLITGLIALTTAIPWLPAIVVPNVICIFALFRGKKWGFYGLLANAIVGYAALLSLGQIRFEGFIGIAILFGVLQLGKPKSGWEQLK